MKLPVPDADAERGLFVPVPGLEVEERPEDILERVVCALPLEVV
jgi:hypothetical protein